MTEQLPAGGDMPAIFCNHPHRMLGRYLVQTLVESGDHPGLKTMDHVPTDGTPVLHPVVMYPPTQKMPNFEYLGALPEPILDNIRNGNGTLILDTSNEGAGAKPRLVSLLHERLNILGIAPEKVVFITQNTLFKDDYATWANSTGQPRRITVLEYHCFLRQMATYAAKEMVPSGEFDRRRAAGISLEPRAKSFLSMNFTPRPHRVACMLHILDRGFLDRGTISFPGMQNRKLNVTERIDSLLDGLPFPDLDRLRQHMPALMELGSLTLDTDPFVRVSPIVDIGRYDDFGSAYFSLVTESGIRGAGHRRFTEKPFKPILGMHPFLIVGLPQTLAEIRNYGFQTFSQWFDESYDTIEDDETRVRTALAEFDRLVRLDDASWAAMRREMEPVLLYNYDRFNGPMQAEFVRREKVMLAQLGQIAAAPAVVPAA